jgi:cell division transport system permease protein
MVNGTQARYLLRETFAGLARRKVGGTAAVVIMASALLMLALFSLITINLDRLLQAVRGGIDVTVYLEEGIDENERSALHEELLVMEGILDVSYVSKEMALEVFRENLGDEAGLLDAVESNPLPASFRLRVAQNLRTPERIEELSSALARYPHVEEVEARVEWVRRLDQITRLFVWVSVIVGCLVVLSSLFVISNTVKLTIQESARTVEVMKLVGATDGFVRAPFVLGGAIQGALAGLLAMVVLQIAYDFFVHRAGGVFFFGPGQILGFIVLSTLLGAMGSVTALRRHLRA